jgi:hypothetical protein
MIIRVSHRLARRIMPHSRPRIAAAKATIARLAQPSRLADQHPIAARFVYSLRLIAVHDRAGRDPVPELATRLGSVEIAAKALALGQAIKGTWPEDIHISRFCCGLMSHDEATIAAMITGAATRDRPMFEDATRGFIRPDRAHRLWDAVIGLVTAEVRAI